MDTKDEILMEAFLLRASPETVYEWLQAWPQENSKLVGYIPKEIESQLLGRKNEIVDLGLAAWGTEDETIDTLYQRWCARSATTAWPPQPSTFPYAVLAAILSNAKAAGSTFSQEHKENFDWLIEHGDRNLLSIMHSNVGLAIELLKLCSAKSGAYGRIDDNRWLTTLSMLGRSKLLQTPARKHSEGEPDVRHMHIHKAVVEAARISPKTHTAAEVFGLMFMEMPMIVTEGAHIDDDLLGTAVSAWNVEISNKDVDSSRYLSEYDALTPAERVQFHLLRHYCSRYRLDPNDPNRVRRLAAYAKQRMSGEEYRLKHGLVVDDFKKYADRDGPAFMYAASFNRSIWRDKAASEASLYWTFPAPEDTSEIYRNRVACSAAVGTEGKSIDDDFPEEDESVAVQTLKAVTQLRLESSNVHEYLKVKIDRVERFAFWGGLVLLVLLLFFFFEH